MELLPSEQFQQQSLMDSAYLPHSPAYIPFAEQGTAEELNNEFFCFPSFYYQQETIPSGSSSLLTETIGSTTVKLEKDVEKKRKQRNVSCTTTAQSKSKRRRMKEEESSAKKQTEERQPPTDYIHVRARRGQATDSHSLAERVRRERISERMKILQGLVPGCEKVTGKALVLDEIINYVESMKNQIEFLSMKLASVTSLLPEFGSSFDEFTSLPEHVDGNSQLLPSMIQSSLRNNFAEMASISNHVFPVQEPTPFPQEDGSLLMQNGKLGHQLELYNMYSFQWMGETDENANQNGRMQ